MEEEPKSELVQQYKAEKHQEENKAQIDFKESLKDELQYFSQEKLQAISEGKDCHLDDPDLFTSKKHLCEKFTPLSVTHAILGKFPNSGITSSKSERKNPADGASMLFSHIVTSANGVQGFAEEGNKKLAQQRACQVYEKNLFPKGTTWKDMIEIVQNDKEALGKILAGEHLK